MASNKQRGLGRDLEALLGKQRATSPIPTNDNEATEMATIPKQERLHKLPIDVLQPGRYQPRLEIAPEALSELANSISVQGIIQPIIVRPLENKRYEIIAGERRWRAAQIAGLEDVPVVVKKINDETASAMALIENVQREDLNPMEEAIAYHRLTDEFSLTHQQVANLVGKSRVAISNLLRLLNLNTEVKTFLENGDLEMGHARALLGLTGAMQTEAAREVVAKSLSVRETENLIRRLQKGIPSKKSMAIVDADTRHLQQTLSEKLGAKVKIQHSAKGKGKLVINYSSLDELEGILAHIK